MHGFCAASGGRPPGSKHRNQSLISAGKVVAFGGSAAQAADFSAVFDASYYLPGDTATLAMGTDHRFENPGNVPASLILLVTASPG